MFIKELAVKNFRNYKNLSLELSSGINLIAGSNATGKSNILESISIISNLKSFRNVPDTEIIKWGENSYFCSLSLGDSSLSKFEIGCTYLSDKIQKKAKIDGIAKKKISEYYGKFLTVIFSPEDINLVTGHPDIRRKFFDAIISKIDTDYLNSLGEYKKILTSRNKLLRDIREKKKSSSSELDIWDNMFAGRAKVILEKRIEFLDIFNSSFKDSSLQISGDEDSPYIYYNSTLNPGSDIVEALFARRNKDIVFGLTGAGPHRDDYIFLNKEGKIFKNSASQGQKRTAAISLKIAECKFLEQETGEKAVILIDDIFGELDEKRRNKMMDILKNNNQIIITAVNPDIIQKNISVNIQKFLVSYGGVIEKS